MSQVDAPPRFGPPLVTAQQQPLSPGGCPQQPTNQTPLRGGLKMARWKSWPIIGWFAFRERKRSTHSEVDGKGEENEDQSGTDDVGVTRLCDFRLDGLVDLAVTAELVETIAPDPDSGYRVNLASQVLYRDPDKGWRVVPADAAI